ncbi:MAG: phosphoadenosine phosphosulfate reductase family protein [bacterium]
MQVFWCSNCNTPVLHTNNKNKIKSEENTYIDIEDEVIEYLYHNNGNQSHYNIFLSLKKKIEQAMTSGWIKKLKNELNEKINIETENELLSAMRTYALRYINLKFNDTNIKGSKKVKCPRCNTDSYYIGSDIRPVFLEERIMIDELLDINVIHKNIWNTVGNRYIVNGEVTYINLNKYYNDPELTKKADNIRERINTTKYKEVDFSNFIDVNREHFQYIDNNAIDFIKRTTKIFNDRLLLVSFSGGKDSTVVSDIVTRALGTQDILHVFGDTTLEFPTTYEYLKRIKDRVKRPPFLPVDKSNQDFMELSNTIGPPSRVMSWCCTIFKTGPIGNLYRSMADEQKILTFYGVRRSESSSRSKYDKISVSPKIAKQLVISPIIDWHDADVWLYLLTRKIDFNEAYKYGFTRVGCWCCPNNSKWSEFLSKIYMKNRANEWRNFLVEFAKRIGKPDPEVYIDTGKWKARQGGYGLDEDEIAVTLAGEPCASEENTLNYNLTRPISDELYELFKPFGIINKEIGQKVLGEVYILDVKTKKPRFILKGSPGSKQLKIEIIQKNNIYLLTQRLECQLRKYQSCIGCTACANVCPYDAISLLDGYTIDEEICIHCMKCIAYFHKGCLVTKTMMKY